ncbi:DUF2306 domain-containing protein [Tunturiibacter gelidoferens]|uniref:DUF2306 domain-containing protein n=1 Tax=Tunturiibacter gelidiferens TaxID=3069689 RepID=A0AAU7YZH7_9BACT
MDAKAPARGIEMREGSSRVVCPKYPGWLKVGFWICVVIAVAVVLRRVAVLAHPTQGGSGGSSPTAGLDAVFASHEALTLAHILPAMAFVLLSPFVLLQRSRAMRAERVFFLLGAWVGVTAYAMSAHPVGGWVERSAVLLFNSLFLFSLVRAFVAARRGEAVEKMRWMLRSVAILLGIATTRPVMGVFFATSRLTHLEPAQFFGVAFWIGFSINTIAIELWLRSRGDRLPVVG